MYILTDVDDVLLQYATPFTNAYELKNPNNNINTFEQGFNIEHDKVIQMVTEFNHSELFHNLPPVDGAIETIHQLKREGFKIIAITACGTAPDIHKARIKNMKNVFGDVFEDIQLVDMFQCKRDRLLEFKGSGYIWIEDNIKNYYTGLECGLQSLLLKTDFNAPTIERTMYNWNDIRNYITKSKAA